MNKTITLLLSFFLVSISSFAQWVSMGSGLSGSVKAITVYNGKVYAGGTFSGNINHIAVYNESNSTWSTAGNGLNNDVNALVVHAGKLYAGGTFTANGANTTCSYIAVLNTSTNLWEPVNSGFNNFVRALYSNGTDMYVGGAFNNSGTPAVSRIAKYSTTGWVNVGDPGGLVTAITTYNGSIYIAGAFLGTFVGRLSGTSWTKFGSGLSGQEASALAVFQNTLYVGGSFNGSYGYGLVKFNGSSFSTAFNPINNYVSALLATPSRLFCGGSFTATTNGTSLPHFFRYDGGTPFTALGQGFNGNVLAFANNNGVIIAGGSYTTAGGVAASNIAKSSTTIDVNEINNAIVESVFYPNPMINEALLSIKTSTYLSNATLHIVDQNGRTIRDIPATESANNLQLEFILNREGMPAGMYYYFMTSEAKGVTSGKFIVQ